jgi:hypothetical protein
MHIHIYIFIHTYVHIDEATDGSQESTDGVVEFIYTCIYIYRERDVYIYIYTYICIYI